MESNVVIRPIVEDDAPLLQEYASDEKVALTCNVPHPYPEKGASDWIKRAERAWQSGECCTFAILYEGEFVGVVRLDSIDVNNGLAELDYFVAAPFWNKGIATVAVRQAIAYAFRELGVSLLHSRCLVRNPASARVLEKNGFAQYDGIIDNRSGSRFKGERWQLFRLTKEEYVCLKSNI